LQNRAGLRGRWRKVMRRHMVPVSRPGVLCRTPPVASATASGATELSGVKPVGLSTPVSSATVVSSTRRRSVSRSSAITRTGVVRGRPPTRPTTAENASLVSVPRSWPPTASLYEPPVSAAFGSLTTRKT
jgi:hypothetical protein